MAITIRFPDAPPVPRRLPLLVTRPPAWDRDGVARVAAALDVKVDGEVVDAGSRLVATGRKATIELFQASNSVRMLRTDLDGEGREHQAPAVSADRAVEVAERYLERLGRPDAEVRDRFVTELEVLRLAPESRTPEQSLVALQVNYRFALEGLPLVGPGAKAQVCVNGDDTVVGAYRFWRDATAKGALAPVEPKVAFRRFSTSPMFAGLDDRTASVEMESVELGLYSSSPSEPQAVLLPAYVFRGRVSTELVPDYRFISYVAAAAVDPAEVKGLHVPHAGPSIFAA